MQPNNTSGTRPPPHTDARGPSTRELVSRLIEGRDLSEVEAKSLLEDMAAPGLDPVLAGAALTALRSKGETPDEIRGFALGLRRLAVRPGLPADIAAVDIVGTGGDGSRSFNLSTGSALVAAAAGVPVLKHGTRGVSSQSGSADVLGELGLEIPLDPVRAAEVFERTGFTFLFAPAYHPAMKSIAPVRQALGFRTIFNVVGPLANPAAPPFHVIGVYSEATAEVVANTLAGMPIERALVVHGEPGWDEPTPVGPYHLFDVTPGAVTRSVEDPADLGFARCSPEDLIGGDPRHNADKLRAVLAGERGPHRDALILGASLGIRVVGHDPTSAVSLARTAIDDGKALRLVEELGERAYV